MWNTHLSHIKKQKQKKTYRESYIHPIGQREELPDSSAKKSDWLAKRTCQPIHYPFFDTVLRQTAAYWLLYGVNQAPLVMSV